jgi:hypothetical protein
MNKAPSCTFAKELISPRALALAGAVSATLLQPCTATAELNTCNAIPYYLSLATHATLGTATVAFGVTDVAYLLDGPNRRRGRMALGTLSIATGILLAGSGGLTFVFLEPVSTMSETRPAGEGCVTSEEKQHHDAAIGLGAANVILGATGLGLGIATLATFRDPVGRTALGPSIHLGTLPVAGYGGGLALSVRY